MCREFDETNECEFCDFTNEQEESFKIILLENEQYLPLKISESLHELLYNLKRYPHYTNEDNLKECNRIIDDCNKNFDDIKNYLFIQYKKNEKKF